MFIPGSHLWGEDRRPLYLDALAADMEIGDTFVLVIDRIQMLARPVLMYRLPLPYLSFLCQLFHAGGGNILTEADPLAVRTMIGVGYNAGFMRTEECQFLALNQERLRTRSPQLQRLCGLDAVFTKVEQTDTPNKRWLAKGCGSSLPWLGRREVGWVRRLLWFVAGEAVEE